MFGARLGLRTIVGGVVHDGGRGDGLRVRQSWAVLQQKDGGGGDGGGSDDDVVGVVVMVVCAASVWNARGAGRKSIHELMDSNRQSCF